MSPEALVGVRYCIVSCFDPGGSLKTGYTTLPCIRKSVRGLLELAATPILSTEAKLTRSRSSAHGRHRVEPALVTIALNRFAIVPGVCSFSALKPLVSY